MNRSSARIAFLFKEGRKSRVGANAGAYPTEFFYGYAQLRAAGTDVSIVEEAELIGGGDPNLAWRAVNRLSYGIFGLNAWGLKAVLKRAPRAALNSYDIIVTTSNVFAVILGAAKRLGLIEPKVISIVMGVITPDTPIYRRRSILSALQGGCVAMISRGEMGYLQSLAGGNLNLNYLPFGVDEKFWHASDTGRESNPTSQDYVLSIGNDRYRDYQSLIDSWRPAFPLLRIITGIPVQHGAPNIEVVEGDWRNQTLSDREVRCQMQNARFVIIPLRKTVQPSGQSACLQAMACGKAVILSDIAGLWDRGLMRHGENCILVKPGDADALGRSVRDLLDSPDHARAIGRAARRTVEAHLNVNAMARAMRALCLENRVNAV